MVSIRDCGYGSCHTAGGENVRKSRVVAYHICWLPGFVRVTGSRHIACAQKTTYAPIESSQ